MATNKQSVIVDSSALISLTNLHDTLHGQAMQTDAVLRNESWLVLIPSEVFAETLNAIGKKIGRNDATLVGQTLLARQTAGDFDFIHAEPNTYAAALTLHVNGAGGPSFVDCLVMALAAAHGTRYIFGFDATFRKNGYLLPGEPSPAQSAA